MIEVTLRPSISAKFNMAMTIYDFLYNKFGEVITASLLGCPFLRRAETSPIFFLQWRSLAHLQKIFLAIEVKKLALQTLSIFKNFNVSRVDVTLLTTFFGNKYI